MKICIVRHGSAAAGRVEDNVRALTDKGVSQATAAGHWLSRQVMNEPVCWSSPFHRTIQTAQLIADVRPLHIVESEVLTPSSRTRDVMALLEPLQSDAVLISHLPLVGHLASYLIDGEITEQPWSPAECWMLEGDVAGPGCMSVSSVWYPALDDI